MCGRGVFKHRVLRLVVAAHFPVVPGGENNRAPISNTPAIYERKQSPALLPYEPITLALARGWDDKKYGG